jgi:hypothetical protein
LACLGIIVLLATLVQASAQQRFKSPDEAAQALVAAAKADNPSQVRAILGPAGRDIVESGDKVADKNARERFLAAYGAGNRISQEGENKAVLVLGQDDWPFPIPLVRADGSWQFDADTGRQEILFRRIGRNERNAIQACLAFVDAQNDYALMDPQKNGISVYAQRVVSRPDKKDGLYWPTKEGEPVSPLGELAAAAAREGYRPGQGRVPYHGYYYKVLQRQGSAAPGGAYDYVARGKMIGGFALVAYPAEYRNSGVMTFVVNHEGAVFQKDLGPRTPRIASRMSRFNPDSTWQKVNLESVTTDKAR